MIIDNKSNKFSLAHLSLLNEPILNLIKIAQENGYDYASPRLRAVTKNEIPHQLVGNKKKINECKSFLKDYPIKILDVELLAIYKNTSIVDDFEAVLSTAAELDAKYAIAQIHDSNTKVSIPKLLHLCQLASQYNITIVLEMLPWSVMSNLEKTQNTLKSLDVDNVGILCDLLHMYRTKTKPEEIDDIDNKYFHYIHLCDATSPKNINFDWQKHIAREARYPAGRGDIPVLEYLDKLPTNTYSLEIPNQRLQRYLGATKYAKYILEDTKNYLLLAECWKVKSNYYSVPKRII